MTGEEADDLTQRWLDGSIRPEDEPRLAAWLAQDPQHRRRYAMACRLDAAIRAEAAQRAPTPSRRQRRRVARWIPVVAAAVLLGAAVLPWIALDGAARPGVMTLVDGSVITVDPGGILRAEPGDGDRFRLESGAVEAVVRPRHGRPFTISTPQSVIQVVGTRFRVAVKGDRTVVSVVEGEVAVAPYRGATRAVMAGGSATVAADGSLARVIPVPAGDHRRLLRAFHEAGPGDTIRLGRGLHSTDRTGQPGADLLLAAAGTADAWITVEGEPGAELALIGWSGIQVADARHVELRNLVLAPRADQAVPGNGIRCDGPGPVRIHGCRIAGFGGSGIGTIGTQRLVIAASEVRDCGGGSQVGQGGIDLGRLATVPDDPRAGIVLDGVTVTGSQSRFPNIHAGPDRWTGGNGISVIGSTAAAVLPIRIRDSVLHGNEGGGLYVLHATVAVEGSVLHRNGMGSRPRGEITLHGRGTVRLVDSVVLPRPGGSAVDPPHTDRITAVRSGAWGDRVDMGPLPPLPGGDPLVPVADEARREDFSRRR